jgi:polyvinyl alcohol dehydrogenase (cytochrome)
MRNSSIRQRRRLAGLAVAVMVSLVTGRLAADAAPAEAAAASEVPKLGSVKEFDAKASTVDPESLPGAKVFAAHCAQCHLGEVPKAPQKMFLQMLSGPTILEALNHGLMQGQAAALSPAERVQVAEYLSGAPLAAQQPTQAAPHCVGPAAHFDLHERPLHTGWGYDNARFIDTADARVTGEDARRMELAWAFEFPGAIRARAQPVIAYGAVYVGSQDGTVYALDLKSGCVRWTFKAGAEVRTGIVPFESGDGAATVRRLVFGDVIARVYLIDALSGRLVWSRKVSEHPNATITGTPAVAGGRIYVPLSALEVTTAADPNYECCTFRGAVVALDAATGAPRWTAYAIPEAAHPVKTLASGKRIFAPSGAPIWNSPEVDEKRGVLYVGTGDNYSSPANDTSDSVIAFRLRDGAMVWKFQATAHDAWNVGCMMALDHPNCPAENGPDLDFGAGLVLVHLAGGRDVLVAPQKSGVLYGLDPDRGGALLWRTAVGRGGIQGGIEFGVAAAEGRIYAGIADMKDEHVGHTLEPGAPGMVAVDAASGKVLWRSTAVDHCAGAAACDPGITAAVTALPGVVIAGQMDGALLFYDATSGATLKDIDTRAPVTTTAGTRAHGGSFGGGGAAVRDGYVVISSGYGIYFHMPGNVLLAYHAAAR